MPFVIRRVFAARVGKADQLIEHFKGQMAEIEKQGIKARILSDHWTGRSDRVAVEWEVNELADLEKGMAATMATPAGQESFKSWEAKMNEMIHYSEAETWSVR